MSGVSSRDDDKERASPRSCQAATVVCLLFLVARSRRQITRMPRAAHCRKRRVDEPG